MRNKCDEVIKYCNEKINAIEAYEQENKINSEFYAGMKEGIKKVRDKIINEIDWQHNFDSVI